MRCTLCRIPIGYLPIGYMISYVIPRYNVRCNVLIGTVPQLPHARNAAAVGTFSFPQHSAYCCTQVKEGLSRGQSVCSVAVW